jgi:hypothetical protein
MPEKKQMDLKEFRNVYGIPENTVRDWIYDKKRKFPAYRLGNKWYVDIPKFLKWREVESARQTKMAWEIA